MERGLCRKILSLLTAQKPVKTKLNGAKIYALYAIDLTLFDSILMDDSRVKNA